MLIRIHPSQPADLPQLMQIYETARRFMQQTGNAGQWVDGYPKKELLVEDIGREHSYVCLDEDNGIAGTFYFRVGEEPTYLKRIVAERRSLRGYSPHCLFRKTQGCCSNLHLLVPGKMR